VAVVFEVNDLKWETGCVRDPCREREIKEGDSSGRHAQRRRRRRDGRRGGGQGV
jgi:hypothetical protein